MKLVWILRRAAAPASLLLAAACNTLEPEQEQLPQGVSANHDAQAGLAWTPGTLAPNATGSVSFTVRLNQ